MHSRGQAEREHSDVVILTKELRGFSNLLSGLERKSGKAVKAVKLAIGSARLEHSIGEQDQTLGWEQLPLN